MTHDINLPADSDGDPIVVESIHLDFIDEQVLEGWVFRKLGNGYLDFQPKEFCGDFWDKFHDDDADAEKVYQDVVNKIYAFHGMEPFYKSEPPKPEPLKDHKWWKEYDEDGNFYPIRQKNQTASEMIETLDTQKTLHPMVR